jgi:hypothetical protein
MPLLMRNLKTQAQYILFHDIYIYTGKILEYIHAIFPIVATTLEREERKEATILALSEMFEKNKRRRGRNKSKKKEL